VTSRIFQITEKKLSPYLGEQQSAGESATEGSFKSESHRPKVRACSECDSSDCEGTYVSEVSFKSESHRTDLHVEDEIEYTDGIIRGMIEAADICYCRNCSGLMDESQDNWTILENSCLMIGRSESNHRSSWLDEFVERVMKPVRYMSESECDELSCNDSFMALVDLCDEEVQQRVYGRVFVRPMVRQSGAGVSFDGFKPLFEAIKQVVPVSKASARNLAMTACCVQAIIDAKSWRGIVSTIVLYCGSLEVHENITNWLIESVYDFFREVFTHKFPRRQAENVHPVGDAFDLPDAEVPEGIPRDSSTFTGMMASFFGAIRDNWKLVMDSPAVVLFRKAVACVASVLFASENPRSWCMELANISLMTVNIKKACVEDVVDCVTEVLAFTFTKLDDWVTGASWKNIFGRNRDVNDAAALLLKIERNLFLCRRHEYKAINPICEYIDAAEVFRDIDKVHGVMSTYAARCGHSKDGRHDLSFYNSHIKRALIVRVTIEAAQQGLTLRKAPFAVLFYGHSNVGKSALAMQIGLALLRALGCSVGSHNIYNHQSQDKYMSGYNAGKSLFFLDDLCNVNPEFQKESPTQVVVDVVNNTQKASVQAAVDDKGAIYLAPRLVVATTNVKRLHADLYSSEPVSILRRFNYTVTVRCRPEVAKPCGALDVDKAKLYTLKKYGPGQIVHDWWLCSVESAYGANDAAGEDRPQVARYMLANDDAGPMQDVDSLRLARFLTAAAVSYDSAQEQFVNEMTDLTSTPLCDHGFVYPVFCDVCRCESGQRSLAEVRADAAYEVVRAQQRGIPDDESSEQSDGSYDEIELADQIAAFDLGAYSDGLARFDAVQLLQEVEGKPPVLIRVLNSALSALALRGLGPDYDELTSQIDRCMVETKSQFVLKFVREAFSSGGLSSLRSVPLSRMAEFSEDITLSIYRDLTLLSSRRWGNVTPRGNPIARLSFECEHDDPVYKLRFASTNKDDMKRVFLDLQEMLPDKDHVAYVEGALRDSVLVAKTPVNERLCGIYLVLHDPNTADGMIIGPEPSANDRRRMAEMYRALNIEQIGDSIEDIEAIPPRQADVVVNHLPSNWDFIHGPSKWSWGDAARSSLVDLLCILYNLTSIMVPRGFLFGFMHMPQRFDFSWFTLAYWTRLLWWPVSVWAVGWWAFIVQLVWVAACRRIWIRAVSRYTDLTLYKCAMRYKYGGAVLFGVHVMIIVSVIKCFQAGRRYFAKQEMQSDESEIQPDPKPRKSFKEVHASPIAASANPVSRTATIEEVAKKFKPNVMYGEFTGVDGVVKRGNFLHLGKVCVVNRHSWPDSQTVEIRITRGPGESGVQTCRMSKSDTVSVDDRDLLFFRSPSVGDMPDMEPFLLDHPTNFHQVDTRMVKRSRDGTTNMRVGSMTYKRQIVTHDSSGVSHVTKHGCTGCYNAETIAGDCGSPVFGDVGGSRVLLGIHMAGMVSDGVFMASTTCVYKSDVLKVRDILYEGRVEPLCATPLMTYQSGVEFGPLSLDVPGRNCLREVPADAPGYVSIVGSSVKMNMMRGECSAVSGILSDSFVELGVGNFHEPCPSFSDRKWWAEHAASVIESSDDLYVPAILDACVADYEAVCVRGIMRREDDFRRLVRPLSNRAAINGIPGVYGIDSMEMKTSAGYPVGKRKLMAPVPLFSRVGDEFVMTPTLSDEVSRAEEELANGRRAGFVFQWAKKDEVSKRGKEKVRIINCAPVALVILMRKFFLGFAAFIQQNPFLFEMAVGVNTDSRDWTSLYNYFSRFGEYKKFIAGDYGKYDARTRARLTMAAFGVFIRCCVLSGNFSDRDIRIMYSLAAEISQPLYFANGAIFQALGSGPSGHCLTVFINGMVNSFNMRYAYYAECVERGLEIPCDLIPRVFKIDGEGEIRVYAWECSCDCHAERFSDLFSPVDYGDDHAIGVPDGHWFNQRVMQKWMTAVGQVYTDAQKNETSEEFTDLSQLTFLKRSFVPDMELGLMRAPLPIASIHKRLHWGLRTSMSQVELARVNLLSAMHDYNQHDRGLAAAFRRSALTVILKMGWTLPLESYDECADNLRETESHYEDDFCGRL